VAFGPPGSLLPPRSPEPPSAWPAPPRRLPLSAVLRCARGAETMAAQPSSLPHTNSTPHRLPSPYYSLKPAELSSTEPLPDYSLTASLPSSPPYKSHPRAPSPHHLPIPHIGPLHPHPYCTPIELGLPPLCLAFARANRAALVPTNAVVRFPSVPSFFRCSAATSHQRHVPVSTPPRPGRESTVDRPE
jgi:hypothetical protein